MTRARIRRLALVLFWGVAGAAVAQRIAAPNNPCPVWLLGSASFTGIVVATMGSTESKRATRLTMGSVATFGLMVALMLLNAPVFLLFWGSLVATIGVVGVLKGQITINGRTGPGRTYSGFAAYVWGALLLFAGATVSLLAFLR